MTPQEDSKPGRTRREGNITYIQTQFATRVRSAIISLAKREAREAIKRKLRAEGTRVTLLTVSEINRLADAHLRAHATELLAKAEASGTVRPRRALWSSRTLRPRRAGRTHRARWTGDARIPFRSLQARLARVALGPLAASAKPECCKDEHE